MTLFSKIMLTELSKNGKNHKWDKCHCSHCQRPMWGHGYVSRYFSSLPEPVYLKRHRCPGCSKVVTVRPETHWASLRSSISEIYQALRDRIYIRRWPFGFSRQRGGHWLRKFTEHAKMSLQENLHSFLEFCFAKELHFFA